MQFITWHYDVIIVNTDNGISVTLRQIRMLCIKKLVMVLLKSIQTPPIFYSSHNARFISGMSTDMNQ